MIKVIAKTITIRPPSSNRNGGNPSQTAEESDDGNDALFDTLSSDFANITTESIKDYFDGLSHLSIQLRQ